MSLISINRVSKIILIDRLLGVTDERSDGLNARTRLQVLRLDGEIEQACHLIVVAASKHSQDADKDLLETLEVPVLVDARVDDARVENLLGLHGQKVAQVVHVVDLFVVIDLFREELRE